MPRVAGGVPARKTEQVCLEVRQEVEDVRLLGFGKEVAKLLSVGVLVNSYAFRDFSVSGTWNASFVLARKARRRREGRRRSARKQFVELSEMSAELGNEAECKAV
jgi:hypothetical protein